MTIAPMKTVKAVVAELLYKPTPVYFFKKGKREKALRKEERVSVVPLYIFRRMASLCRLESRV